MMDTAKKKYDVKTAIRLLAPREVGITLAPLSQIEEAEMFLFWSAVFCSLFTALLGALVSLLCASYQNKPLLWALLIFLLIFLGLLLAFAYLGFSKRNRIRHQTLGSDTASIDALKDKYSVLYHKALLLRLYYDLATLIFFASDTVPWEKFRTAVREMTSTKTAELGDRLADLILAYGVVTKDEGDPNNITAKFNKGLDITKFDDTSWKDLYPSWDESDDRDSPTNESSRTSD